MVNKDKPNTFDFDFKIPHWPFDNLFPFDVVELTSQYILDQLSQLSKSHPRTLTAIGAAIVSVRRSRDRHDLLVVDQTP